MLSYDYRHRDSAVALCVDRRQSSRILAHNQAMLASLPTPASITTNGLSPDPWNQPTPSPCVNALRRLVNSLVHSPHPAISHCVPESRPHSNTSLNWSWRFCLLRPNCQIMPRATIKPGIRQIIKDNR